ncbi:MAG: hypothetical protein ACOCRX_10555, partial [Candidatus Woesearchaeota archaeon]
MKKTDLIFALSHFCSILFNTFYNFPCISIQNKNTSLCLSIFIKYYGSCTGHNEKFCYFRLKYFPHAIYYKIIPQ